MFERAHRSNERARGNTDRQERGLLERLEPDAHEVGAARARTDHDTLQIDDVHSRPGAGVIAAIAQRHLEAKPVVSKRLARVDVVEEVPYRHAEPPVAEVAPDAMGRGVRRTRRVGADFALHRAEDGSIGVEREELPDAGGGGGKPGADDGPRPPLLTVLVARVLPLRTLARLRNGLGLRPRRGERERTGQQQCPQDSCGRPAAVPCHH